ncbi:hypothetical protein, partial [Pseudomonas fragariae (ex Marin et al. 2024)]
LDRLDQVEKIALREIA